MPTVRLPGRHAVLVRRRAFVPRRPVSGGGLRRRVSARRRVLSTLPSMRHRHRDHQLSVGRRQSVAAGHPRRGHLRVRCGHSRLRWTGTPAYGRSDAAGRHLPVERRERRAPGHRHGVGDGCNVATVLLQDPRSRQVVALHSRCNKCSSAQATITWPTVHYNVSECNGVTVMRRSTAK